MRAKIIKLFDRGTEYHASRDPEAVFPSLIARLEITEKMCNGFLSLVKLIAQFRCPAMWHERCVARKGGWPPANRKPKRESRIHLETLVKQITAKVLQCHTCISATVCRRYAICLALTRFRAGFYTWYERTFLTKIVRPLLAWRHPL